MAFVQLENARPLIELVALIICISLTCIVNFVFITMINLLQGIDHQNIVLLIDGCCWFYYS